MRSARHTSEKKPRSSAMSRGRSSTTPSRSSWRTSSPLMIPRAAAQIGGIFGIAELVGPAIQVVRLEIAELECDLLEAHDLQALALFDRADERAGVVQAVVRAGVEPRI